MKLLATLATVAALSSTVAWGADLAGPRGELFSSGAETTTAVVDQLFLHRNRCPRGPDCIAPRVGDVYHGRSVVYRAIATPIDPRVAARAP